MAHIPATHIPEISQLHRGVLRLRLIHHGLHIRGVSGKVLRIPLNPVEIPTDAVVVAVINMRPRILHVLMQINHRLRLVIALRFQIPDHRARGFVEIIHRQAAFLVKARRRRKAVAGTAPAAPHRPTDFLGVRPIEKLRRTLQDIGINLIALAEIRRLIDEIPIPIAGRRRRRRGIRAQIGMQVIGQNRHHFRPRHAALGAERPVGVALNQIMCLRRAHGAPQLFLHGIVIRKLTGRFRIVVPLLNDGENPHRFLTLDLFTGFQTLPFTRS